MDFDSKRGRFVLNGANPCKNKKACKYLTYKPFSWGARWDSNPRHSEPQSDALTN